MTGKSVMLSTPAPFALSLSKGKRGVFQHPVRNSGVGLMNPDSKKHLRHLRFWTPYDRSYRHFDLRPAMILEVSCRFTVNPVPRTYIRGFRACPSARSRTFTPYSPRSNSTAVLKRAHVQGVLWYRVKAALWRGPMLIREYFTSGIISHLGEMP